MSAAVMSPDPFRELLTQAISEVIRSWPDRPRRIFSDVHYRGKSVADVARASGLSSCDVGQILESYERRLRICLRPFRESNPRTHYRDTDELRGIIGHELA